MTSAISFLAFASMFGLFSAFGLLLFRHKNLHRWLPQYGSAARIKEPPKPGQPTHVFIAICDHWEPEWNGVPLETSRHLAERWRVEYPRVFGDFGDSDGRPPQHTFFIPQDGYRPEYVDSAGELCHAGFGDIEVHLHHDGDTAERLAEKLDEYRRILYHRHGFLRKNSAGEISYGFIHGNWALCNSRPDGRWCGVDQELSVLLKTGCYADFTMPSAPSDTQIHLINSIYYARDVPGRRRSHEFGQAACVGQKAPNDHLLMIQGPLALDWKNRTKAVMPRIENGDITKGRPMSLGRLKIWLEKAPRVIGQPNWLFVKLHTHGCNSANIDAWLGGEISAFHSDLASFASQRRDFLYHYVTAWEMAQLVHQAEAGATIPRLNHRATETSNAK